MYDRNQNNKKGGLMKQKLESFLQIICILKKDYLIL